MNTRNQQNQKKSQQRTRQDQGSKKRGQDPNVMLHRKHEDHEQEHAETRLFR